MGRWFRIVFVGLALTSCLPAFPIDLRSLLGGPRRLSDTFVWSEGLQVQWTWVRTNETIKNQAGSKITLCLVSGTVKNTSQKSMRLSWVSFHPMSKDDAELCAIRASIGETIEPGQTIQFTGKDYILASLSSSVDRLRAKAAFDFPD